MASFGFLREALVLPSKNKKPFLILFTLYLVFLTISLFCYNASLRPVISDIRAKSKALVNTDPSSPEYSVLVDAILKDTKYLLAVQFIYAIIVFIIFSTLKIITYFTTTTTYSGEVLKFQGILGRFRNRIKQPVLTVLFIALVLILLCVLVALITSVLFFLSMNTPLLIITIIFACVEVVALLYFTVVCELSLAVSVADTACYGARAVGRAWNLLKDKKLQAIVLLIIMLLASSAISPVYYLGIRISNTSSLVAGILLVFIYAAVVAVLELLWVAAITVLYYESSKKSQEEHITGHQYQALSGEA